MGNTKSCADVTRAECETYHPDFLSKLAGCKGVLRLKQAEVDVCYADLGVCNRLVSGAKGEQERADKARCNIAADERAQYKIDKQLCESDKARFMGLYQSCHKLQRDSGRIQQEINVRACRAICAHQQGTEGEQCDSFKTYDYVYRQFVRHESEEMGRAYLCDRQTDLRDVLSKAMLPHVIAELPMFLASLRAEATEQEYASYKQSMALVHRYFELAETSTKAPTVTTTSTTSTSDFTTTPPYEPNFAPLYSPQNAAQPCSEITLVHLFLAFLIWPLLFFIVTFCCRVRKITQSKQAEPRYA